MLRKGSWDLLLITHWYFEYGCDTDHSQEFMVLSFFFWCVHDSLKYYVDELNRRGTEHNYITRKQ